MLPSRRKRASKGQLIRISDLVFNYLNAERGRTSWDAYMRKRLGLPDRHGNSPEVLEGWIEVLTGRYYSEEADARGAAVVAMAKRGTRKFRAPIRIREVL